MALASAISSSFLPAVVNSTLSMFSNTVLQPVSYTHLDVYKRQVLIPEGLVEFIPAMKRLIAELNDFLAANCLLYTSLSGLWNMPGLPEGGFSGSGRILPFQAIKLPGFI